MKQKLLCLFIICFFQLFFIHNGHSQNEINRIPLDSLIVKQIIFVGNNKTKEIILRREIKSKIGEPLNLTLLEEDKNRLLNLRLFSRVEIQPLKADGGIALLFLVAEQWYIFPYPIFYNNERDWGKLSYGAGLVYQNFRGMNTTVAGSFWLGYNPGMNFYYMNPWIWRSKQLFLKLSFSLDKIRNKSPLYDEFDENYLGISCSLGKRFGYHTYLTSHLGYKRVHVPDGFERATASQTTNDNHPYMGLSFRYDNRDLMQYAMNGWFVKFYGTRSFDFGRIDYFTYGADIRRYNPLFGGLSVATRLAVDMSYGFMPVYEHKYIGYLHRIRGHFDAVREGLNRFMGNIELRFPIIKVRHFDMGEMDFAFGSYGHNLPFGISGGLFYDTGVVWDQGRYLTQDDFLSGFGLGLHFHVPYVDLLRVEYSWDTNGDPQFIIDTQVWF